jgi:glutathione S-transferase
VKLYNSDLSPFASCVRLVIYAKGIESQVEIVSPPDGLKSPAYLALNPIGKVPSLQVDGWVLPESTVICEFLDERFPEPGLRPSSAEERARMRLLTRLVDLYLYPGLLVLFGQANAGDRAEERVTEGFRMIEHASTHLLYWFGDGSHAVGDRLTLADCSLVPALFYVRSLSRLFQRDPFGAHPKLGEYYHRVSEEAPAARVVAEMKAALAERRNQQAR